MRSLAVLLFALAFNVMSADIISGRMDSSFLGEIIATGPWSGGRAEFSYSVYRDIEGIWHYEYVWLSPDKAINHLVIQTPETFKTGDIFPGTSGGWELGSWSSLEGRSNIGLPDTLYGLKWKGTGKQRLRLVIVTDHGPMIGSFFAKDGRDQGLDVFAYNFNFSSVGVMITLDHLFLSHAPPGFIPVPGAESPYFSPPSLYDEDVGTSPEPGTIFLLIFGVGLVFLKRRTFLSR